MAKQVFKDVPGYDTLEISDHKNVRAKAYIVFKGTKKILCKAQHKAPNHNKQVFVNTGKYFEFISVDYLYKITFQNG